MFFFILQPEVVEKPVLQVSGVKAMAKLMEQSGVVGGGPPGASTAPAASSTSRPSPPKAAQRNKKPPPPVFGSNNSDSNKLSPWTTPTTAVMNDAV